MLKLLLGLLIVLITVIASSEDKVAIIDTGYTRLPGDKLRLCDRGHYDFVNGKDGIGQDYYGHGTLVGQIVHQTSEENYRCILVYRVLGLINTHDIGKSIGQAIQMADKNKAKVINISMGGPGISFREREIIRDATSRGIKIFVAAGNDAKNLNDMCDYYPACYDIKNANFRVVGSLNALFQKSSYSNFGTQVNTWAFGEPMVNGAIAYGTSFASPNAVGIYLRNQKKSDEK